MMRTQTGVLWQTSSADGGATLAPSTPSALASSDSPPFLLRLNHGPTAAAGQNGSAILLLWVKLLGGPTQDASPNTPWQFGCMACGT